MNAVENAPSTQGTRGGMILTLIVGVVIGLLISAGAVFFFFKDAIFFMTPSMANTGSLSYPNPSDQKVPDLNLKTNILLPKKLVGEDYYLLINKIADGLTQVGTNNVSTLVPLMEAIKQKSVARDFNGFFDLIAQAKNEIKKDSDLLMVTRQDISAMRKINDTTIKDTDIRNQTNVLLNASDVFVQTFTNYFVILNETLSGSVPTQSLLNKLSAQVTSLGKDSSSVQLELNALLTLMGQKNKETTP